MFAQFFTLCLVSDQMQDRVAWWPLWSVLWYLRVDQTALNKQTHHIKRKNMVNSEIVCGNKKAV